MPESWTCSLQESSSSVLVEKGGGGGVDLPPEDVPLGSSEGWSGVSVS